MQAAEGANRVCSRHESRRRRRVPEAVGVLVPQQPAHAPLHDGVVRGSTRGLERDQRDRGGRRVAVVLGPDPPAAGPGLAGVETPAAVVPLEREEALQVQFRPIAETLMQDLRLRDATRGIGELADLVDIVVRPDAMKELDAMAVVVRDADVVSRGENLAPLLLESEEVARLSGVPPRAIQDLGRELEHHVGAEVRAAPGGVDALRVGRLQDVVRGPPLPLRMHGLGPEGPLVEDDVAPGDARARRAVAQIVGSDARVHRRVPQFVGQAQRLVHRVDETAVVLLGTLGSVAVPERVGHAPDAALRMAAHAVLAEQRGGVARPPMQRDVARSVDQPGVDLRQVVVDPLADSAHRVVVRRRIEQPHLHLVVRLVGLDAQVVGLARLQFSRDERTVGAILLVRALVERPPLLVGVDRNRARHDRRRGMHVGNRVEVGEVVAVRNVALAQLLRARPALLVEADAGADDRLDDLQVRTEKARLAAPVLDAIPIVGRLARSRVVVVLDIVRAPDHVQDQVSVRVGKLEIDGLLGSVVGLGLQHQRAVREIVQRSDVDPDRDRLDRGRGGRKRGGERRQPGIARNLAERLRSVRDRAEP